MYAPKALKAYQTVGIESGVIGANPHQLVLMLLKGALDRITTARGAMLRGEIARKGEAIGQTLSIVDSLRASVDQEKGGQLAVNLVSLYTFVEDELLAANLASDPDRLQSAGDVLTLIADGWEEIGKGVNNV
ncbi:MAG: flagellar export chaperone FliS [Pseudomonadota bacterium]